MLALKRKESQAVWVGEVRILVKRVGDRQVRLVFDGPRSIRIIREELLTSSNCCAGATKFHAGVKNGKPKSAPAWGG
jgi:sRNA-binding carbon storage regulator CsrA